MGISVVIDNDAVKKISAAVAPAALKAMHAVHADVIKSQVMPFDQGTMQDEQTFVDQIMDDGNLSTRIVVDAAQARRLYYHPEYNFQTVNNPNAGGEWFRFWLPGGEKEYFAQEEFVKTFKKEADV